MSNKFAVLNKLINDLETKVRYVKTPEGSRLFKQPIGSVIVTDKVPQTRRAKTSRKGGNRFTLNQMVNLQLNKPDPLREKIYNAEEKYQPEEQRKKKNPYYPKRKDFKTVDEYKLAYKDYEKAFEIWAVETSANIKSDLGKKHLNGGRAGIKNYVDEIILSDWFVAEFGDGKSLGTTSVSLSNATGTGGRFIFGKKDGRSFNQIFIDRGFTKAEPIIMHEIAHYATIISTKKNFSAHGVGFAKNHVYIASQVIGSDYALGLKKSYRKEGIKIG